jgi:sRNA-binding protein
MNDVIRLRSERQQAAREQKRAAREARRTARNNNDNDSNNTNNNNSSTKKQSRASATIDGAVGSRSVDSLISSLKKRSLPEGKLGGGKKRRK